MVIIMIDSNSILYYVSVIQANSFYAIQSVNTQCAFRYLKLDYNYNSCHIYGMGLYIVHGAKG